jgi:FkbM family methyltransferase
VLITLLIDKSAAFDPSLKSLIETRAGNAESYREVETADLPGVIDEIAKNSEHDDLLFLLSENIGETQGCRNAQRVLRIVNQSQGGAVSPGSGIAVADCARLASLYDIEKYPGISWLLRHADWSEGEYRSLIMSRYENALDALFEKKQVAVFGAQRLGERIGDACSSLGIDLLCYLDNNQSKQGETLNGTEICGLEAIQDKALPIIIGTTRFETSIARQLRDNGFSNVIPYPVMSLFNPEKFADEIPYIGIQKDFSEHADEYLELFLSLEDDKSRKVLDGLILSRLYYDSSYAGNVSDKYTRQYFDEQLVTYSSDDVYVDLGGYDGDTAEKYLEYSGGKYSKIYLFEPDRELLEKARIKLSGYENIEYVAAGAYSRNGVLRFDITGTTNGAITDSGELEIPVSTLDSVVSERPTLIKMDIEGSESDALIGCNDIMKKYSPKLAVAAYHFSDDLWRLRRVILGINTDYRFYLRHYSETGLETVLYAIKNSNV